MRRVLMSLAVLAVMSSPAYAQPREQQACGPRMDVLKNLEHEFSETSIGVGVTPTGFAVELVLSADGSWTLLATDGKRVACVMAAGDGWTWRNGKRPETGS